MPPIKDLTPEFVAEQINKHWSVDEIDELIRILDE